MPRIQAREAALVALRAVDGRGAYAGQALSDVLTRHRMDPRDRGLATELVYGVCRRLATLDWALEQVASRPLAAMTAAVRNILRLSAYQLLYLERVPAPAVIHEAVDLGKKYGHAGVAGFINAVLRSLSARQAQLQPPALDEDPVAHLAITASVPEWICRRWLAEFGLAEAQALLAAMAENPPLSVRANSLRTTRDGLLTEMAAEGLPARPARWSPHGIVLDDVATARTAGRKGPGLEGLRSFRQGLFLVQDESSQLVSPLLDPRPGQLIIDQAAAPGGKTTHIAELMGNTGRVVALDPGPDRVERIAENCRRLGVTNVQVACADGRSAGRLFPGAADAVLCDLPCSGLGTLARRPDLRWRKKAEDIPPLVTLQKELLTAAAATVRSGGVLVYSTCTLTREENQDMAAWFAGAHPEFSPDDLRASLPPELRSEASADGAQLLLLPHRHGTDGFFIARFRRR